MQFRNRDKCAVQTWRRRAGLRDKYFHPPPLPPSSFERAASRIWKWNRMRAKWLAIRGKSWKWSLPDASFLYIFLRKNNISEKYTYPPGYSYSSSFSSKLDRPSLNFWSNALPTDDGWVSILRWSIPSSNQEFPAFQTCLLETERERGSRGYLFSFVSSFLEFLLYFRNLLLLLHYYYYYYLVSLQIYLIVGKKFSTRKFLTIQNSFPSMNSSIFSIFIFLDNLPSQTKIER